MIGLNLHNFVSGPLNFVNPEKQMTFTKTTVAWKKGNATRQPTKTTQTIVVSGKLQPASEQQIFAMGFNAREYQYFKGYISSDATQIDRIRQLGADTFVCDGQTYRIVAKNDWIQDGWRSFYCYLDNGEENA